MKRFILNIALFGIILLIIVGAFELFLMRFSNEFSYKHNYLKKHNKEIEVLILGASQSSNCIDPSLFKNKTFNAAITARYIYNDYKIAMEFVPQMPKLKAVILTVSNLALYRSYNYHFTGSMEDLLETEYKCMYVKYMGQKETLLDLKYWPETINSHFDYIGRIFAKNDQIRNNCDSLGYQKVALHAGENWQYSQMPHKTDYNDPNLMLAFNENVNYIKEISRICDENNVTLYLVHVPYYKTAQEKITTKDKELFKLFINRIKSSSPNIVVYNLMNNNNYEDEDFFNAVHLNYIGAKKLSKTLNNLIIEREI